MRLLVLGGTVFLSKAVAALAVERGWDVTVAARGVSGEPPPGVHFVPIDRSTPEGVAPLADESFDAVVDVARVPGHVGVVLDALADNAAHWTFVSTCSVYADNATPGQVAATAPLLEPTDPTSFDGDIELYGRSKVACEKLVLDRLPDRALVIRAGLIIGPGDVGDRFGHWPHRIAKGGEVLAPGGPEEKVQFIDVDDLATWILDAAEAKTSGVHDGIRPPMTRKDFLDQIAAALDVEPEFTWVAQQFLVDHGIAPWSGEESLGLWLPLPEYDGFLTRDTSSAVAAGMNYRPLAETVHRWRAAAAELPVLKAGISSEKETSVLDAWHARNDD